MLLPFQPWTIPWIGDDPIANLMQNTWLLWSRDSKFPKKSLVPLNPAQAKVSRSATPSINTLDRVGAINWDLVWHQSENLKKFSAPRYWGSYSASYPAGGGGDSGSVAESRASFEWAQFGSAKAPRPVPQRTSTPRRAPSRVSAPRATPAPRAPVVPRVVGKRWAKFLQYFAWTQSWIPKPWPSQIPKISLQLEQG